MSSEAKPLARPPGLGVAPPQAKQTAWSLQRQMQRQAKAKSPRSHASSLAAVLISLMPRRNAVKRRGRIRLQRARKRVSRFEKTLLDCGLGINGLQNLNTRRDAFKLCTRTPALLSTHPICRRHTLYRSMHPHHRRDQSGRHAFQMAHKVV